MRRVAGGVGWVATDNLHITVKFLGQVPLPRLGEIGDAVGRAVTGAQPFDLAIQGLGAFPTATRPRVVWAGLGDGAEPLGALAARVEDALAALGFEREARAFSPHVTLGRVREPRRDPRLEAKILAGAGERFGTVRVDRVCVMRSELSPRGARYSEMSGSMMMGGSDTAPHPLPRSPVPE
jgi:2'-5' RNA ligase